MSGKKKIRHMHYAGSWYDGDPDRLSLSITDEIRRSSADLPGFCRSLDSVHLGMLPHAGLAYSSRGISGFFSSLPRTVTRFVIIAPSHYTSIPRDAFTTASLTAVETPMAIMDAVPLHELLPSRVLHIDPRAVDIEHALEMFLPFCAVYQQMHQLDVSVGLCLISHASSPESVDMLAEAMLEALGDEQIAGGGTAVIASSDFTHYGLRFGYAPFGSEEQKDFGDVSEYERIEKIEHQVILHDREYAELFAAGNLAKLIRKRKDENPTICGFSPGLIVAAMAEKLGMTGCVADQYTSNEASGVSFDFVSYCSIFWGQKKE